MSSKVVAKKQLLDLGNHTTQVIINKLKNFRILDYNKILNCFFQFYVVSYSVSSKILMISKQVKQPLLQSIYLMQLVKKQTITLNARMSLD